ncbi:hypothetical protein BCR36DRAFT_227590, partial [Piromyces finnis]
TFFANYILAKIDKKEFCLHNYNGITKIVDPFYINSKNETIYFDTIEEYSKYIGPTWFGVAYCGNNTIVNNVGRYFKYIGDDRNNNNNNNNNNSDNGNDNGNDNKNFLNLHTKEEFTNYYSNLYDKLMDPEKPLKCVPLNSVNPAYN